MNKVTIERLPARQGSRETQYLVKRGECPIGLVTKFRDDRSTVNPWKAFRGIGDACKIAGFFYKADGGFADAVACVAAA